MLDFPETPKTWRDDELATKWEVVRQVRRVVTGAIEIERTAKVIGASLEAAPTVHIRDADMLAIVKSVDFADVCITSGVSLSSDPLPDRAFRLPEVAGVGVEFEKAEGEKCLRCWKVLPDVGKHDHEGVCGRCDEALG